MDDRKFEDIIRSKLQESEAEVPARLWEGIAGALPSRRAKTVRMRAVYRYAAALAALLLIGGGGLLTLRRGLPAEVNGGRTSTAVTALPPANETTGPEEWAAPLLAATVKVPESGLEATARRGAGRQSSAGGQGLSLLPASEPDCAAGTVESDTAPREETAEPEAFREGGYAASADAVEEKEYEERLRAFAAAGQELPAVDYRPRERARRRGFTVGLMASNALPDNQKTENRPLTRSAMVLNNNFQLYQAEEPLKFMHKVPLSFGLTAEKRLPRNWGIESGLVYTLLRSDYQTPSLSRKGKQEFHYIGIPLNAIYRFASVSRLSFYAAAGGEADFNISGRRIEDARNDNKEAKQTEDIRDRHVQWSVHAKAGAACTLFKTTELYAEPGVSYYIGSGNLPNLWKDQPVNFVVQIGWRTLF